MFKHTNKHNPTNFKTSIKNLKTKINKNKLTKIITKNTKITIMENKV